MKGTPLHIVVGRAVALSGEPLQCNVSTITVPHSPDCACYDANDTIGHMTPDGKDKTRIIRLAHMKQFRQLPITTNEK